MLTDTMLASFGGVGDSDCKAINWKRQEGAKF
jgi:hypothetical protein